MNFIKMAYIFRQEGVNFIKIVKDCIKSTKRHAFNNKWHETQMAYILQQQNGINFIKNDVNFTKMS